MSKLKIHYKIVPIILIVSFLFTSCKIPDISKFTEASAEMTRGIRTGVTETASILETASKRDDLFGKKAKDFEKSLKNFKEASAPTLKALKGLDAYLEALNALAKAQQESSANAEAAVNSVASLASELNVIKIPDTAIKLATGLVALAEVLRTERDFKKRVILAERIVNGGTSDPNKPCTLGTYKDVEDKTREFIDKLPNSDTKTLSDEIDAALKTQKDQFDTNIKGKESEKEGFEKDLEEATKKKDFNLMDELQKKLDKVKNELEKLNDDKEDAIADAGLKKDTLYNNAFVKLSRSEKSALESAVGTNSCGVIDILKFNVRNLKKIYDTAATEIYQTIKDKNKAFISYHGNVVLNDNRTIKELDGILSYEQKVLDLSLYQSSIDAGIITRNDANKNQIDEEIRRMTLKMEVDLNAVYVMNGSLKVAVKADCNRDANCKNEIDNQQYLAIIKRLLTERQIELLDLNKRYTNDLERINPRYTELMTELEGIENKRQQMLKAFDASVDGLDTWGETHRNLRDSLTAKKPFTAARLFTDARFILEVLKIGETEN